MSLDNVKAIHLKSGEMVSITEAQCEKIQQDLLAGAEWVFVQGELIHKGTIARVGTHGSTVEMRRYKALDDTFLAPPREQAPSLPVPSIDEYPLFSPSTTSPSEPRDTEASR